MKTFLTTLLLLLSVAIYAQNQQLPKETPAEEEAQDELLKADQMFAKNQFAEAVDHYTKAITLNSDLICAYVYRAKAYLKLDKEQDACADLQKADKLGCWRPELEGMLKKCGGTGKK